MPLRRSPRLTPALLEANRRNAQKSTGPRTVRGKQAVRLNRLGAPVRLRRLVTSRLPLPHQLELAHIYASLYYALAPRPSELLWLEKTAAMVWRTKWALGREVRDPAFRMREAGIWRLPEPLKMQWDRPGPPGRRVWRVSVVLGARQNRGPTGLRRILGWWDGRRGLHVQLVVRCSFGRTWRPSDGPLRPGLRSQQPPVTVDQAPVTAALSPARNVTPATSDRPPAGKAIKATMFKILKMLQRCLLGKDRSASASGPEGAPVTCPVEARSDQAVQSRNV
ncbi:MAG TPA: hypothetical protein VI455_10830 [Terriglobia bacterium]